MPCLEISLPKTTLEIKQQLIFQLTEITYEVAGFEREIFRIRFHEYAPGEAGTAGKLWMGEGVPYLHFLLFCPRLRRSVKKVLMESLSSAFVEIVGKPDWFPVIHICEHPYDNIAAGGKILWERHPELLGRKFYFDLPED